MLTISSSFRALVLGLIILLGSIPSWAQTVPSASHGYEFLTVLVVEPSINREFAKIVIVPAFKGQSEISLAGVTPQYASSKALADIMNNTAVVNQLLGDLTVAGWELFQSYPLPPASGAGNNPVATRYLFRKPRP